MSGETRTLMAELDAEIARRRSPDYQWFPKASDAQTPSARVGAAAARAMQHGELTGLVIARELVAEAAATSDRLSSDVARRVEAVIAAWEREPVWTRPDVIAGLRAALTRSSEARTDGPESVSPGGDVPQSDGPVVDEPAATDSDPLERARVLIETIAAASAELATLYGPLWHLTRSSEARTEPEAEDGA